MTTDRRPYRRESEESRRDALISAALELVAEGGPQAATIRAIAERAGVTPGLIRHYFTTKDELTRTAYGYLMDRMTNSNAEVLQSAPDNPASRLAVFVAASLNPPIVDPLQLGLWAGFLHGMRRDPSMRLVHAERYYAYRDLLQSLIAALPRVATEAKLRADAIACNAVIDGLWLEGSALPEGFASGELEHIGMTAVGAILGIDLMSALPGATGELT